MTGANTIPLGGGGIKTGSRALGGGGGSGGSLLNPSYLSMPNVKHERKYTGTTSVIINVAKRQVNCHCSNRTS